MRKYFEDLILHEVAEISGAGRDNIKRWIKLGYVTQPRIFGKWRRFSAAQVCEIILFSEINNVGMLPHVASSWLTSIGTDIARYLDDAAIEENGKVRLDGKLDIRLWIVNRSCINIGQIGDDDLARDLPQHTLVLRLATVFERALNKAMALRKGADDQSS